MNQAAPRQADRGRRRFAIDLAGLFRGVRVLALAALVAGCGWGTAHLYRTYDVPIAVIGVKGELKRVQGAELEAIVAGSLGGGFLSLDLTGITAALEEHPWIASASARRKWPDEVVITVEEETPIARWGDNHFLSNQGKVLDVADVALSETLPLLDGPEGKERRVMQQYRNFSQVLRPLGMKVESCQLAPRENWTLTFANGMALTVGKEPVAEKLGRFLKVWNDALQDRAEDIAHVDIRYANGVAVRWKESIEAGEQPDKKS